MKYAPAFQHHLSRYSFATYYAWKRDTIDVGSKDGFGAQMLSFTAKSVTLADISPRWLRHAENRKGYACPVDFRIVDLDKEYPIGEWDTAVAFEVIEHVEDPDFLVRNIADHLRPEGRLVFSVPHMVENHEHKTLFDEKGIRDLIEKYMDIQEFYVQDKALFSDETMYGGLKCYVGVAKKK